MAGIKGLKLSADDLATELSKNKSADVDKPVATMPAVNRVKVARGDYGNTMKKMVLGREVVFTREVIEANKVDKTTTIFFLNERDQDLLNHHGVADILPSIKKAGINDFEAYARKQNNVYELADGSRRRRACVLGHASLALFVADLSDKEMEYLSESGNKHKQASVYERGLLYKRWIKEGRYTSIKDMSREIDASRRTIQRCVHAAELPKWLVKAYKTPNDMSSDASARLYTMFKEGLISDEILKKRVDHCMIMWNHHDYTGKDVTEALTYIEKTEEKVKPVYLAKRKAKITTSNKGIKLELPVLADDQQKKLKDFIEELLK